MSTPVIRCPLCIAVVDFNSLLSRLWPFGGKTTRCRSCGKTVSLRDAKIAGDAFAFWMRKFKGELVRVVEQLPVLEKNDALRAMLPGLDIEHARSVAGIESLAHFAAQVYRPILNDKAQGREAELDVVLLDEAGKPRAGGMLGQRASQTGEAAKELLFTCVGRQRYLVYLPENPSARVHDAVRVRRYGNAAVAFEKIANGSLNSPAMAATRARFQDDN